MASLECSLCASVIKNVKTEQEAYSAIKVLKEHSEIGHDPKPYFVVECLRCDARCEAMTPSASADAHVIHDLTHIFDSRHPEVEEEDIEAVGWAPELVDCYWCVIREEDLEIRKQATQRYRLRLKR